MSAKKERLQRKQKRGLTSKAEWRKRQLNKIEKEVTEVSDVEVPKTDPAKVDGVPQDQVRESPERLTLKAIVQKLEEAYGARKDSIEKAKLALRTNLGKKIATARLVMIVEALNEAEHGLAKDLVMLFQQIQNASMEIYGLGSRFMVLKDVLKEKGLFTEEDLDNALEKLINQQQEVQEEKKEKEEKEKEQEDGKGITRGEGSEEGSTRAEEGREASGEASKEGAAG